MAREIIHAGLHARGVHRERHARVSRSTARSVEPYTLEVAEQITGVPADVIREAAHTYASADKAMICWTLGITEHHNAVDNVLALINLALLTGHVGRWGSGCNPLRGQNNVQGGGDMGAIPNKLPGFQDIDWTTRRARASSGMWGVTIQPKYGWNLTEMLHAMDARRADALYVIGENPAQSDADAHHVENAARRARPPRGAGDLPHAHGAARARRAAGAATTGARARARSPTASAACSACARRWSRPRARATNSGSSPRLARRLGHDWGTPTAEQVWNELRAGGARTSAAA